jgi:hypothetical protein
MPFVVASYTMYGVHPDKLWAKMMHNREQMLRNTYPKYCNSGAGQLALSFDKVSGEGFTSKGPYSRGNSGLRDTAAHKSVEYSPEFIGKKPALPSPANLERKTA